MDMSICRKSVCMADDVDNHTRTYTIEPTTTFSDILEMSRHVQSGNTQNLKSSAAPVRLPAAPASTPGTSQAVAQAGCVYRP